MSNETPARMSGGCHGHAAKRTLSIQTNHRGAVWIAQDDLRTHIDEFIRKETGDSRTFFDEQERCPWPVSL